MRRDLPPAPADEKRHICAWTTGSRHCLLPANITEQCYPPRDGPDDRQWWCAYHYACRGAGFSAAWEDFAVWVDGIREQYGDKSGIWGRMKAEALWRLAQGRNPSAEAPARTPEPQLVPELELYGP